MRLDHLKLVEQEPDVAKRESISAAPVVPAGRPAFNLLCQSAKEDGATARSRTSSRRNYYKSVDVGPNARLEKISVTLFLLAYTK